MKYLKTIGFVLSAFLLTACSDEEDFNTAGNVSVQLGETVLRVNENDPDIVVPVVVTGDANGPIRVKFSLKGTGSNPAEIFENHDGGYYGNVYLQSDYLNIPSDEKIGYLYFSLVDDKDKLTGDRTFSITIESAEGATIGTDRTLDVTILENDIAVPQYTELAGDWSFNYLDYSNMEASFPVQIAVVTDEKEEGYGSNIIISDMFLAGAVTEANFYADRVKDSYYIEITVPARLGAIDDTMSAFMSIGTRELRVSLATQKIRGDLSADGKTITFDPSLTLLCFSATNDLSSLDGLYDLADNITMTKQ